MPEPKGDQMSTDLRSTLLFNKTLGCLIAGLIGDAMGTDTDKLYNIEAGTAPWIEKGYPTEYS